jgi:hypothetical protein
MMDRAAGGDGFRVLDGAALVMGAAVASVHIRNIIHDNLGAGGWVLVWCTFTWVALTATGPFLFLVRRFARRLPGYPQVGDGLWALLGCPWLMTAIVRSTAADGAVEKDEFFAAGLGVALAIASLIALVVVWKTWVMVPPEQAAQTASMPWTNRVGLVLAVAWPVQCGIGLVVTS